MKLSSFFAAALASLVACFLPVAAHAEAKKLNVLTTFAPISSMTKNIVGDAAEVQQLLPPDAEPHHFALKPSDLKKVANADVVVENGLGAEEWVEGALKGSRATRIIAGQGIKTDDGNPHVWLDPVLAMQQVETIAKGLAKRDPANAALYQRNAAAYIERLKALDKEIRTVADQLPDKRLMTSHGAFHYFAKRYGFDVVGVFEEFPGREPSPRALRALRDTIAKNQVKVLFTEPGQPRRVLRNLSRELRLPVVEIDPMEYGKPDAALYEAVMRSNLRNLKEALGGGR